MAMNCSPHSLFPVPASSVAQKPSGGGWRLIAIARGLVALGLPLLCTALASTALSQGRSFRAEDLETPRTLALGTGVRASSVSTAALANNPSGMTFSRQYHLEALTGFSPSPSRWTLGSAVVDSSTSQLAAGGSFRGILSSSDSGYHGYDARAGAAFPFGDSISVGVAGRYLSLQPDQGSGDVAEGFTLDAAVTVQLVPGFRIAGLGYNLVEIKVPDGFDGNLAPRRVGGSASYTGEEGYSLGLDVLVDLNSFDKAQLLIGGGAEYLFDGTVPIRIGYQYDAGRRIHAISGGAGYVDTKFGVEVAVRQDLAGDNDTLFLLSARYFVQ